ncbi:MAG TPA: CHASE2 domain-containing protein, partial [bacterium]|nr:CHASE2 domain-containing protein [bacterium]
MKPKPKRLRGVLLLTPVLVGLTVFFLFRLPAWRRFELITYDWRMKKTGPKPVSGNVVIVFIGDETLKLLGRWPLPRNWYASLTEVLKAWGARVVAYDILFLEESGDRVADRQFGEAVTRAGNVIHSCYFQGEIATRRGVLSGEHLLLPPEVLGQATAIGFVNTPPDDDGITRRYPFFANHQGRLIPSLGLAILKEYYQLPGSAIKMGNSHTLTVTVKGQPHLIPVDQTGSAWLTIYPDLKMFPHYAMVQVLQSYAAWSRGKKSSLSPEAFTDKIVLVAHTAAGTTDIGPVAGRERYLKVGLHASFLESFFHDDFIRPAGTSISLMAPVCGALAAAGAAAAFPPLVGFIFTCLLGCLFIL